MHVITQYSLWVKSGKDLTVSKYADNCPNGESVSKSMAGVMQATPHQKISPG